MKIPLISLQELWLITKETLLRFPVLSFLLFLGVTNQFVMDIYEIDFLKYYSQNFSKTILLAVPFMYTIQLLFESDWIHRKIKILFEGIALILAGFYFFTLPNSPFLPYHHSQFWLFLSISLLSCLVGIKKCLTDDDLFWHFHIKLLSRFLITSLYSLVIVGGSSAAFAAIDALFSTQFFNHHELRIVILTSWVFSPLFFLAGIPKLNHSENLFQYKPSWIKNISIYVLIPFTIIYLGILYAYMAKISIQGKLPQGMVSSLILSFAAFGITTIVIGFPFQKDENSKWTYWFGRSFYFLQFPLLILLGLAIYQRVLDYGITFNRYFVILLALWLFFITVFMVVRKNKNLIAIPLSLLIFALSSVIGPWNVFHVSFVSQKSRLDKILTEHGLIVNEKLSKPHKELSNPIKNEICSITKYLSDNGKLNVYLSKSNIPDSITPNTFTEQLGFEFKDYGYAEYQKNQWFNYTFAENMNKSYGVGGDSLDIFIKMNIQAWQKNQDYQTHWYESPVIKVKYNIKTHTFEFKTSKDTTSLSLKKVVEKFESKNVNMQVEPYIHQSKNLKIVCLFNSLSGNRQLGTLKINTIQVDFLIDLKE